MSPVSRRRSRPGAWLALAAMLALALVPTLSRALGSDAAGRAWAGVCSADGTGRTPVGEGAADPTHSLDRCALCALAAAGALAGPQRTATGAQPSRADEAPRVQLQRPRARHPARAAQPRGPPPQA